MKTAVLLSTLLLWQLNPSLAANADDTPQEIEGLFINYEGAEYENTFFACGQQGAWRVEENDQLQKLATIYQKADLNQYGELYVRVKAVLHPYRPDQYPASHFRGTVQISRILDYSEHDQQIGKCHEKKK